MAMEMVCLPKLAGAVGTFLLPCSKGSSTLLVRPLLPLEVLFGVHVDRGLD
jgi:hypothetical protein